MGNTMIFGIAISLSMDTFSLSLAYGTQKIDKKSMFILSSVVGLFHFFMPFLGMFLGKGVMHILPISSEWLVCIILSLIGLQMIIETFKKNEITKIVSIYQLLIFGLSVSIDSFSVGIGLPSISKNYLFCSAVFAITSFTFTYLGLVLGKRLGLLLGKFSTIIGGIALIVIGLVYAQI